MEPEEISDEVWLKLNHQNVVFDDPVIKQMFITQLRRLEQFDLEMKKRHAPIVFKPYKLLAENSLGHNRT